MPCTPVQALAFPLLAMIARVSLSLMLADADAGGADFVRREHRVGHRRRVGDDEREVETRGLGVFDAAAHGGGAEALRGGDTAVDGFERGPSIAGIVIVLGRRHIKCS
jgi:hypothetical protein